MPSLPPSITSRQNPRVRALAALPQKKHRDHDRSAVAEGVHLTREALRHARVRELILSESGCNHPEVPPLIREAETSGVEILVLSDPCYAAVSNLRAPEGVAVVVDTETTVSAAELCADPKARILVAVGVQDPGNAGALARVFQTVARRRAAQAVGTPVAAHGQLRRRRRQARRYYERRYDYYVLHCSYCYFERASRCRRCGRAMKCSVPPRGAAAGRTVFAFSESPHTCRISARAVKPETTQRKSRTTSSSYFRTTPRGMTCET